MPRCERMAYKQNENDDDDFHDYIVAINLMCVVLNLAVVG